MPRATQQYKYTSISLLGKESQAISNATPYTDAVGTWDKRFVGSDNNSNLLSEAGCTIGFKTPYSPRNLSSNDNHDIVTIISHVFQQPEYSAMGLQPVNEFLDTVFAGPGMGSRLSDHNQNSSRSSTSNVPTSKDNIPAALTTATRAEKQTATSAELTNYPCINLRWKLRGYDAIAQWEREPDIESIAKVMESCLSPSKYFEIKHMWEGAYNKFYSVDVDNNKYVMKVILPVCPRTKTESEVTTIRWTAANTNLRSLVPQIIAYGSSTNNPIGCEWILMTRLEGVPLSSCWRDITLGSKERIVRALAEYCTMVYKKQFRQIGNLFPAPLPCRGRRYQVGKISSMRFFWNRGPNIESDLGPFRSNREWALRRINIAHEQLWDRFREMRHWPKSNRELTWRMLSMSGVGSKLWGLHEVLFPRELEVEEARDDHEVVAVGSPKVMEEPALPVSDQGVELPDDTEHEALCSPSYEVQYGDESHLNDESYSMSTATIAPSNDRQRVDTEDSAANLPSKELEDENKIVDLEGAPCLGHQIPVELAENHNSALEKDKENPRCTSQVFNIASLHDSSAIKETHCTKITTFQDQESNRSSGSAMNPSVTRHSDRPNHPKADAALAHNPGTADRWHDWEPLRPDLQDHIDIESDPDLDAEATMLWHDDLSADNILVDPETGRLTGILDWDCVSCLPVPIACDWPAFLHEGKHRTKEPEIEDYVVWVAEDSDEEEKEGGIQKKFPRTAHVKSVNTRYNIINKAQTSPPFMTQTLAQRQAKSHIALQANYWRALRDFELTYLRRAFIQEMADKCPGWYEAWRLSKVHKDYEAAVQNCDNEHMIHKVEAWCEAVEAALEAGQEIRPPHVMSLHYALYDGPDWKDWEDLDEVSVERMKIIRKQERKLGEWQSDIDELHAARKGLSAAKGTRTRSARNKANVQTTWEQATQAAEKLSKDIEYYEGLDGLCFDQAELENLRQQAREELRSASEVAERAKESLTVAGLKARLEEEKYEAAMSRELAAIDRIRSSEWFRKLDRERTFNQKTWENLEKALIEEYGSNTWWKHRLEHLRAGRRKRKRDASVGPCMGLEDEESEVDIAKVAKPESEISEEE
jgi:hypothetical protein